MYIARRLIVAYTKPELKEVLASINENELKNKAEDAKATPADKINYVAYRYRTIGMGQKDLEVLELSEKELTQGEYKREPAEFTDLYFLLGYYYYRIHDPKALGYFLEAMTRGCPVATNYVGEIYLSNGDDFDKRSIDSIYQRLNESVKRFKYYAATMFMRKDRTPLHKVIAKAYYQDAIGFFQRAADVKYLPAEFNLNLCFFFGIGEKQECKRSLEVLNELALKSDNPKHLAALAKIYLDGLEEKEIPKNIPKALALGLVAAKQGSALAQFIVATIYHMEDNFRDYDKAIEWYKKSVEQGYAPACLYLYQLVNNTQGEEEARAMLTELANLNLSIELEKLAKIDPSDGTIQDCLKICKGYLNLTNSNPDFR